MIHLVHVGEFLVSLDYCLIFLVSCAILERIVNLVSLIHYPQLLHFQVSYIFQTPVFLGASDAVIELLRQNAQAFSQISSNLSACKVFDLHFLFYQ